MKCILCKTEARPFVRAVLMDSEVEYFHCPDCDMIFLNPENRLAADEEKERYHLHENDIHDEGYKNFLMPLLNQIEANTTAGSKGLDYGSGPNSLVTHLLREKSYSVSTYDPYFANDLTLLNNSYDFIVCNEAAEHFYDPKSEFQRLFSLLNSSGSLFVGTSLHASDEKHFLNWYYRRDPTHVCFYSEKTFQFLADLYRCRVEFKQGRVIALKKVN